MPEKYIFDIAFYWCGQDSFYREYGRRLAENLAAFEKTTGYPLTESLRMSLTDSFWRKYIAPWKFNQAVGWVRLYKLGSQLRGELWYMNAKRAGRQLTKKQFSSHGKAFELHVYPEDTSETIYKAVLGDLHSFVKSFRRKVVLDLEAFEQLGPYVNWRALMDDA
jgi:hypothetical protein